MSIGRIVVTWGDGEKVFDVQPLRWLRELETKTGVGAFKLLMLLRSGEWKVDQVRHVIRTGLLGGGMTDPEANALMSTQFDNRPVMENVPLAVNILAAGLFGGSETLKKKRVRRRAKKKTTTDASPSPDSTASAPS